MNTYFHIQQVQMINSKRVKTLREGQARRGPVVLWMSRDQRMNDNWALLFAQELAIKQKTPLAVIFCLVPQIPQCDHKAIWFYDKRIAGNRKEP